MLQASILRLSPSLQVFSFGVGGIDSNKYAKLFLNLLSTVGYGDIHPFTAKEQLYAMMGTLLGSGVFAWAGNILFFLWLESLYINDALQ